MGKRKRAVFIIDDKRHRIYNVGVVPGRVSDMPDYDIAFQPLYDFVAENFLYQPPVFVILYFAP
jgi:hypothetical protein